MTVWSSTEDRRLTERKPPDLTALFPPGCDLPPRLGDRGTGPELPAAACRRLPAAAGVVLLGRQVIQVDADHGLAQAPRHLGDHVRVVVEGGGLDDRGRALGRVAGLE